MIYQRVQLAAGFLARIGVFRHVEFVFQRRPHFGREHHFDVRRRRQRKHFFHAAQFNAFQWNTDFYGNGHGFTQIVLKKIRVNLCRFRENPCSI